MVYYRRHKEINAIMKYYVNAAANAGGDGSKTNPFKTIQQAADIAVAGDEVIVAPGIYRENVNPKHAGKEGAPIVYRSSKPLGAHITGAEPLTGWKKRGIPRAWALYLADKFKPEWNTAFNK